MEKLSVADAAEKLGISKEAIHNRIRRGSLKSVVEENIKYVLLDKDSVSTTPAKRTQNTQKATPADKYYSYLETQNQQLLQKIEKLENETRTLREQKEQMLIEEKQKIEEIYKQKDEQLKQILQAISSKFLPQTMIEEPTKHLEAEIETTELTTPASPEFISLKSYLKLHKLSDKKKKKIKEKLKKESHKFPHVEKIEKKYYIDSNFDYAELLR